MALNSAYSFYLSYLSVFQCIGCYDFVWSLMARVVLGEPNTVTSEWVIMWRRNYFLCKKCTTYYIYFLHYYVTFLPYVMYCLHVVM